MKTHVRFITLNAGEIIYPIDKMFLAKARNTFKVFEVGLEDSSWEISEETYKRLYIELLGTEFDYKPFKAEIDKAFNGGL